jgi:heme oxygenase
MKVMNQQDLRSAVRELHTEAEQTRLAQELVTGQIAKSIYKNYCYQLYLICDALESKIKLPETLIRRHQLVKDIAESGDSPIFSCYATEDYINYIKEQEIFKTYGKLKGHIYTHYLGWLYGGQLIAKKLQLPAHHLSFADVAESTKFIRSVVLTDLTTVDIAEAKIAFECTIKIYRELYERN